jgi:hypothetical protein
MNRIYLAAAGVLLTVMIVVGGISVAVSKIEAMVSEAAKSARAERDYYWRGEIEQMRADAQKQIAENLRQTMAAQNAARDQVAAAEARASELEKENAALPDGGDRGIGRDRVRLLNKR